MSRFHYANHDHPEAMPLFVRDPALMPKAIAAREAALVQVTARAERADVTFTTRAAEFAVQYLTTHGQAGSEEITDACKAAGIIPPDDRAFGPVFMNLARAKRIEKAGICPRRKGHGTSGGNIWKLKL